jgi:hypothetical protein
VNFRSEKRSTYVDNCGKPIDNTCLKGKPGQLGILALSRNITRGVQTSLMMTHRSLNSGAIAISPIHSNFCFIILSMVGYGPTMVFTSKEFDGNDSWDFAWDLAKISKESSRRANYPILRQWGSDKK